jgi:hypothetical protein
VEVAGKDPAPSGDGRRTDWLAGLVVGALAGVLTLIFPTLGWGIALVFGLLILRRGRRLPAFGGLFLGLGAAWVGLLVRAELACRAFDAEPGQECIQPDIGPWLAVGAMFVAIGIVATVVAVFRRDRGSNAPG